jgi:spore maturation protein CgeB
MKIALFYHSLLSDWNNGNAHFLRGIVAELQARGHEVTVFEPQSAWSRVKLIKHHGEVPLREFRTLYPQLRSTLYRLETLELDQVLDAVDMVIVHEWNDRDLILRLGAHRQRHSGYVLFYHDTHHRALTEPQCIGALNLLQYDGVLAYGRIIRDLYLAHGWAQRAWTWHEAADTRVFYPRQTMALEGDLVWIGNWGDEERTAELHEFLLEPVAALKLQARMHGVRYPRPARQALAAAGIAYAGWLPNYKVPQTFAQFRLTVHIPRRPYVQALPGVPTIRPFEALACGMPLVSALWEDVENLFTPGQDFLVAQNGRQMQQHIRTLLCDRDRAQELARHGRRTILQRHTCAHRVDELMQIYNDLTASSSG